MKRRKHSIIPLCLCYVFLIIMVSAVWAGMSGKDVVRRVRETFESLESFSAKFKQTFEWKLVGETQTLTGTITAMKDNRYRIETEDQVVVTDGQTVWNYSKTNNQVIIDVLGKSADAPLMRDLLVRYSEDYRPKLAGEEIVRGKGCYIVSLTAKEDEFISNVTLWVDKESWITLRIRQSDVNQNVNIYDIWDVQKNPEVSVEVFKFEAPKSAEVIDLR